jgi:CHAT domain-containing protein
VRFWLAFGALAAVAVVLAAVAPCAPGVDLEREAAARCANGYRLTPGRPVPGRLRQGGVHVYRIARERNEVLDAVVEQRGIDVAVVLRRPMGRALLEVNSPNGSRGPEPVFTVAASPIDYCLEVQAGENHGDYAVRVEPRRPASSVDRMHAEAFSVFNQGEQFRKGSEPDRAVSHYEKALALWETTGNSFQQGITLFRLGSIRQDLGPAGESVPFFLRALLLLKGHPGETAAVLSRLGGAYASQGRNTDAFKLYQQSLEIGQKTGDLAVQAVAFDVLGRQYMQWGEYESARSNFEQSLRLWEEYGHTPRNQANLFNELSGLDLVLGRPEEAYERSLRALESEQVKGHASGAAISLRQMGEAQVELGNPRRALPLLERSIEMAEAAKSDAFTAYSLVALGNAHLALGELDQASVAYKKALNLSAALNIPSSVAIATASLAGIAYQRGDWRTALQGFDQARSVFEHVGDRAAVATTLYDRALAHRTAQLLPEARADLEQALVILEELRQKPAATSTRASFLASRHDYYELYIDTLMQLAQRQSTPALEHLAFESSERARARALLDELGERNIRGGVDPRRLARATQLERRLVDLENQRQGLPINQPYTAPQRSMLETEIQNVVDEQSAIRAEIRRNDPHYADLTQPRPLTLPEIQERVLDEGTALLAYTLGEERSYLWLIRRGSFSSHELAPRREIESAARDVYTALSKKTDGAALRTAAARLSQLVLDPIASELGQDRLLVVADGALQYIPFAALPLPVSLAHPETPLTGEHEVISLPSASIAAILRQEIAGRPPPAQLLAAFADPVFQAEDKRVPEVFRHSSPAGTSSEEFTDALRSARDLGLSGFVRLRHSADEAEAIFRFVPRGMGHLALGFEATRELALQPSLGQYRIIHFATHALLDTVHPALSGIVLSLVNRRGQRQNGFLSAYEIYNLHLPVDLVVLSACETALGKDVKGEGLIGLTRGFMYAGAPRVVVSLWSVSDKGTAEFMQRFYRNMLVDGLKPAAALRAAQRSMLADPAWSSPYYWAGFVLQGEWR